MTRTRCWVCRTPAGTSPPPPARTPRLARGRRAAACSSPPRPPPRPRPPSSWAVPGSWKICSSPSSATPHSATSVTRLRRLDVELCQTFRPPASSLHSGTSKSAAARTICKSYSCIAFYFLTPSSLRCNSALPQHNNASSTPGPVLTTSSTASDYEDDCWYGTGRFFRCGDRCVWWTTTCSCGNTTLDFLKLSFSQYCCPQSAPCEQVGSGVHCPDGKVLDISEQCEDKCYNDWRTSEVLDPLNSNFKCEKSLGRDKKSLCLPTAEMCQGLEICGEVDICNKNDLRCPRNQNNKISSARIFTPSGLPEVTIRNLPSQLTSDHYY